MSRPVDQNNFWKTRIKEAQDAGDLRLSVYRTSPEDWEHLCKVHRKICDELIGIHDKVIDVGCGYGRLSEWFGSYIGIDFSEDFIKKAKELYPDKQFYTIDAKDTGFLDKEFDWAVCVSLKGMIERELGSAEWYKIEYELKRITKNILLLEYSSPQQYEIINHYTN